MKARAIRFLQFIAILVLLGIAGAADRADAKVPASSFDRMSQSPTDRTIDTAGLRA